MGEKPATVWDLFRSRGYSRREFLRFCAVAAAAAGIDASGLPAVVQALDTKPRPPMVWLHFQECTCCSESFIRSSHPLIAEILLDRISLDYTQTLQAASGARAEEALQATMKSHPGEYICLVEGAIPVKDGGIYCTIAGRTALEIVREAAAGAKAVIAWGSCASNGCIQAASPNPTGARPVHEVVPQTVINVPGCPPIADVMSGVVVHLLTFGRLPELDGEGRPMAFYSKRVHDTCYRRPYYDAGLFVETFDDTSARKGYCLYKMGCRGPVTYNSCGVIRWNQGVSYPIQSGHPCIGCSEEGYWDIGRIYSRLESFPGFGIETTADRIGGYAVAAAAGAMAVHAVSTNLRKRKMIRHGKDTSLTDKDIKPAGEEPGRKGGA